MCAVLLAVAVAVRAGLPNPKVTPDGELYLTLAGNLAVHQCYSDSPPASGECRPSWGNQPPGYPVFIAGAKLAGIASPRGLAITQTVMFVLAIAAAAVCLRRYNAISGGWAIATVLVLSFSPVTSGWSHWILTETLGAAASLMVIVQCLRSLKEKSFRWLPVCIWLATATMLRWDLIWLTLPVFVVFWRLRNTPGILFKGAAVAASIIIPMSLLVVRALAVGLPPVPTMLNAGPDELPPGIVKFWRTTSIRQTSTSVLLWNVWNRDYESIATSFDDRAVVGTVPRPALHDALMSLSALRRGEPVPAELDARYAKLADDAAAAGGATYWPSVWLHRAVTLWTAGDEITKSGLAGDFEAVLRIYRTLLVLIVLSAPMLFPSATPERSLAVGVAAAVVARTLFLVVMNGLETRYLAPVLPSMELLAVMLVATLRDGLRQRSRF